MKFKNKARIKIYSLVAALCDCLLIDTRKLKIKIQMLQKDFASSYKTQIDYELLSRTHYAYGTYHAALQAKALGVHSISVIEFGVAGGNGLVELENVAREVSNELCINIDVFGFDGVGWFA